MGGRVRRGGEGSLHVVLELRACMGNPWDQPGIAFSEEQAKTRTRRPSALWMAGISAQRRVDQSSSALGSRRQTRRGPGRRQALPRVPSARCGPWPPTRALELILIDTTDCDTVGCSASCARGRHLSDAVPPQHGTYSVHEHFQDFYSARAILPSVRQPSHPWCSHRRRQRRNSSNLTGGSPWGW